MANGMGRLRRAVERLYELFGKYRGERHWDDPLDNLPEEEARRPEKTRVKDLPGWLYKNLGWHGLVWFSEKKGTVQYFLPRVLEGFCYSRMGEDEPVVPEHFAQCMRMARWERWKEDERAAVQEWFEAWFEVSLEAPAGGWGGEEAGVFGRPGYDPEKCLRCAAFAGVWLGAMLSRWSGNGTMNAALHLERFIMDNASSLAKSGHLEGWGKVWEEGVSPEQEKEVVQWLLGPGIEAQLERAFFAAGEGGAAGRLSAAVETLRILRSARGGVREE